MLRPIKKGKPVENPGEIGLTGDKHAHDLHC